MRDARSSTRGRPPRRRAVGELIVDRRRIEDVLHREEARTDDPCTVSEPAARDLEVTCRQERRPLVNDLTGTGEELLMSVRDLAADDDDRRIERVDERGQHVAETPAGGPDEAQDVQVVRPQEAGDISAGVSLNAQVARRARERSTAGDRLEAPGVTALALDRLVVGHADVP